MWHNLMKNHIQAEIREVNCFPESLSDKISQLGHMSACSVDITPPQALFFFFFLLPRGEKSWVTECCVLTPKSKPVSEKRLPLQGSISRRVHIKTCLNFCHIRGVTDAEIWCPNDPLRHFCIEQHCCNIFTSLSVTSSPNECMKSHLL